MSEKRFAYWHSGHSHLVSYLTAKEAAARRKYIREHKPENERGLRLRLMKRVRGEMPPALGKANAAWIKYDAAWDKAYEENMPAIEALHAKECKNCPWDGKTIFPRGASR